MRPALPTRRKLQGAAAIALGAVVLVTVVLLADRSLRGWRLDLTAGDLFTISPQTREVLAGLERPVTLTLYFSRDAAEGVPYVRQYARRVEELLRTYAAAAGDDVRVRVVDPEPLTRWRDRAIRHGLQPVPASSQDTKIYLGLVGTNRADGLEVIEFLDPRRERFLEYEITRLVWSLSRTDEPVVGLVSTRDMTQSFDLATGRSRPPWAVVDRIERVAEVREIDPPIDTIASDVDVLMLVHPHGLQPSSLYAIDQYLTHGGRAAVFLDPVAGTGTRGGGRGARRSELGPLLEAWGVEVTLDRALADPEHGLVVSRGQGYGRSVHPGLIGISNEHMAEREVITAGIERVVFGSPGAITDLPGGLTVTPVVRAPPSAGLADAERFVETDAPGALAEGLEPAGERRVVAARLSGDLRSAFPDGPPEGASAPPSGHRVAAAEPAHLVLFGDSDLLADRLWVRTGRQGQGSVRRAWAGNGDLVANAIEKLSGSDALLRLRGEGTSARPFTRVRELEREAAERLGDERRRLRDELEQTQQKLERLRSGRGGGEGTGVILSEAQRSELDRLRQRRARLRERLRALEERVDAAVEALGRRLKLLNIVAVPLAVVIAGLAVLAVRRYRRRGPA